MQNWVDKLLGRRPKGADVKLTIVPDVQKIAQSELQGQKGAIVVLDPKTGALIASASAPTFDPANLDDRWATLSKDPSAPLLNRPTQGLYVPGSAFKVVTGSAGLDTGKVTPDTEFVDTGTYVVFGGKVTNYGGAVYGPNDLTTAMTLSINTTFAKVGNLLGRKRLIAGAQQYGFYQTPPLELPAGEVVASGRYGKKGLLSPDAFMDPLDVAWAACGQERLLATPLQMALVAGGIANGGRVMKPYYLQEIVTPDGQVVRTTQPEQWLVATKPLTATPAQRHDAAGRERGHGDRRRPGGHPGGRQDGHGGEGRRDQPGVVHRVRAGGGPADRHRRRRRGHAVDRRRGSGSARRRGDQDGAGAARPALRGRDRAPVVVSMRTKERGRRM